MKAPHIRVDYVLICEDIRLELGNKPSAMGIFTDDVAVLQFPIHFPKFCFLIHGSVLNDVQDVVVTATFQYPKLTDMVLANQNALRLNRAPGGFVLNLMISPLVLVEPGEGELTLDFGTGRKFRKKFTVQQATQSQLFGSPAPFGKVSIPPVTLKQ